MMPPMPNHTAVIADTMHGTTKYRTKKYLLHHVIGHGLKVFQIIVQRKQIPKP